MKTLNDYIQEKLVIFPSQVNEKLVINKSYKSGTVNNEIYNVFKNDFQWLTHNSMWYTIKDADDISISSFNSLIRKKLNDAIKPCIPNDRSIFIHFVHLNRDINIFYDMLDLLNKKHNDVEFLCDDTETIYTNNNMSKCKVIVKVFETDEHVIGIVGPENKSDSTSSNTLIIFAYK